MEQKRLQATEEVVKIKHENWDLKILERTH